MKHKNGIKLKIITWLITFQTQLKGYLLILLDSLVIKTSGVKYRVYTVHSSLNELVK